LGLHQSRSTQKRMIAALCAAIILFWKSFSFSFITRELVWKS
jgi:hypothetical protein